MMDQAALLRRYHVALCVARNEDQLTNYHIDFMERNKVSVLPTPPGWVKTIRKAHRERVAGNGSPAACDAALNEALRSIGP